MISVPGSKEYTPILEASCTQTFVGRRICVIVKYHDCQDCNADKEDSIYTSPDPQSLSRVKSQLIFASESRRRVDVGILNGTPRASVKRRHTLQPVRRTGHLPGEVKRRDHGSHFSSDMPNFIAITHAAEDSPDLHHRLHHASAVGARRQPLSVRP